MKNTTLMEDSVKNALFLAVDDLQSNLNFIEQCIKKRIGSSNVITTSDPEEGLAICSESMPDIVILDIQMPVMSGIEMCKRIKMNEKTADIPVILMTGHYLSTEFKTEGYEAGASDFISKPIKVSELVARVNSVLKSKWNKDRLKNLNQQLENEIKKRDSIENSLIEAKELAEKANTAKTEFISTVSHELRSHLHAIYSYSQLGLKRSDKLALEKHKSFYGSIHIGANKLIELTNDLLDLSKMEFGKMEYSMAETDILPIFESVVTVFQSLLDEKELTVTMQNHCNDTTLLIDGLRIEQVISNLLSNAIKFSPPNESIDITISNQCNSLEHKCADLIKVSVSNKGPKIDEKDLTAIFEKFTQSKEGADNLKGTGLGLAICREIVKAHGGKIWAENGDEKGVTFNLLIPKTTPVK